MRIFGWSYTAEQIADYQRIELEKVYEMPTIEAINAMSYLKGKAKYIEAFFNNLNWNVAEKRFAEQV